MNDIPQFGPFTTLGAWRDAMRQFLDEGLVSPRDLMPSVLASTLMPVDVLDVGEAILIRASMPGVKAENLKITVNGNILALKGEAEADVELEGATYLRRERHASAYNRSITLPLAVEADQAQAVLLDGILSLTLPKSEKVRPKTIKVATS